MASTRKHKPAGSRNRRRSESASNRKSKGRSRGAAPIEEDLDIIEPSEIDQVNFGPLASFVGYRIRRAYGRVFQSFNVMFEPLEIAFGQYSVLTLIGLNPGISQMALADASGIDRSTVVPITDRFVRMGWVRRVRRRNDRRMYALRVTPAGQAVLERSWPIIAAHDEQIASALTKEEREQLIDMLARINKEQIPSLAPRRTVRSKT